MKITNRSPSVRPIADDAVPPIKEDSHDTCLIFLKPLSASAGKAGRIEKAPFMFAIVG
jgi:hypothetical protein